MFKLFWNILKDEDGGTLAITRVTANTLITATATNARSAEIEAVINGVIDADNLAADGVTAVKLHLDVVRPDYGLSQHTTGALQVDPSDTNPALEISDGGLRVKVDDSSIERASGGLQLKDGGIAAAKLASDSVETAKIKDANVTTAKIADSNVTAAKLASDSVETAKIKDVNVTTAKIANSAVTAAKASALYSDWVSKSINTSYLAETDGVVVIDAPASLVITGCTDGSNPPTTARLTLTGGPSTNNNGTFPVRKGDYWKVNSNGAVTGLWWLPLGS